MPIRSLLMCCLVAAGFEVSAQQQVSEDSVIQLEATIRGNKEQPNVLSIVPWQLPQAKTIETQTSQSLILIDISPLTRAEFKREIAAYSAQKTPSLSPEQPRD